MKKSIFKKIGGLFLGLAMGLGVAVGVTTRNKASEVRAESGTSYTFNKTASTESGANATDGNWSFSTAKNSGSNGPTISNGKLRLYPQNSITVTGESSVNLTSAEFSCTVNKNSKGKYPTGWSVDKGTITTYATSLTSFTVSDIVNNSFKVTISSGGAGNVDLASVKVYYATSEKKVESIDLDIKNLEILSNDSQSHVITASIYPNDATNQKLLISSDNLNIASLSSSEVTANNGTATFSVTGKGATSGTQTITVKSDADQTKSTTLTITAKNAAAPLIEAETNKDLIWVGETTTVTATPKNFTPTGIQFSSSNTGVATVDATSGVATAIAAGSTNITASSDSVTSNAVTITVKKATIALDRTEVTMKAEATAEINVTPSDFNGTATISASVNNSNVTTSVSGNRVTITAGSAGGVGSTVTITGTDAYGHTDSKTVDVNVSAGVKLVKVTSKPTKDTEVYLIANEGTENELYVKSGFKSTTSDPEQAATFIFDSNGYIHEKDTSTYLQSSTSTSVSTGGTAADFSSSLGNETYPGLLQLPSKGRFYSLNGSNEPKMYANNNLGSYVNIYAYEIIQTVPAVTLVGESISGYKSDLITDRQLKVENTTATGVAISYMDGEATTATATSTVASATCTTSSAGYDISVSLTGVGSTKILFTVTTAAKTFDPIELSVTSKDVPHHIVIGGNAVTKDTEHENTYLLTMKQAETKQPSVTIYNSNNEEIPVTENEKNKFWSKSVGEDGHLSQTSEYTSSITGANAGTGTVTYTALQVPEGTTVTAILKVTVEGERWLSINTVNPKDLSSTEFEQGSNFEITDLISSATGTKYIAGSGQSVNLSELSVSFTNSKSECTTSFDEFGENVTMYVFHKDFENSVGTITIPMIKEADHPLVSISLEGIANNSLSILRNGSYDLDVVYNPENTTEKGVVYSLNEDMSDEDCGITVTANGHIEVGAAIGKSAWIDVKSTVEGKEEIGDYVVVTIARETQTVHTIKAQEESWDLVTDDSSLAVGDKLIMAEPGYGKTATNISSQIFQTAETTFNSDDTKIENIGEGTLIFTLGGSSSAWTLTATQGLLYSTAVKKLAWDSTATGASSTWTISIDGSNNATILNTTNTYGRFLYNYNNGGDRFIPYATTTSTSGTMVLPKLYRLSGGNIEVDKEVSDTLFSKVMDANACFTCDFNAGISFAANKNWGSVKTALSGLTGDDLYIMTYGVGVDAYTREGATHEGNEVENFLSVYDYLVTYKGYENFLSRNISSAPSRINSILALNEVDSSVWVISAVALVGLTAIGGYFFYRKRKEI